jgi:hypothetical protein
MWPPADWNRPDALHFFLQVWYHLADPVVEDALYDSAAIDLGHRAGSRCDDKLQIPSPD